jgi:hypothetical protein
MMFSWEWSPSFGGESKPQQFLFGEQVWTFARGGQQTYGWLPLLAGVWAGVPVLTHEPIAGKIPIWIGCAAIALGWWLSRRFTEKGWRISQDNHLLVLTQTHRTLDLGHILEKRLVSPSDFESFKSKSFNSLRFPMLQFKSNDSIAWVIGTFPRLFSQGFQIPFTLGFFYSSVTWGSFELQSGADRTGLVLTDQGKRCIIVTYTPEALNQGLSLPAVSP